MFTINNTTYLVLFTGVPRNSTDPTRDTCAGARTLYHAAPTRQYELQNTSQGCVCLIGYSPRREYRDQAGIALPEACDVFEVSP